MGYSQKTDNYELPQYEADDRPSYLGDWNEAMNKLDTGMNDNKKDITDVDNKVFNVTQRLQTTEDNMSSVVDKADESLLIANNAIGRFPVASNDIQEGSITAPKIANSAIQSILSGFRVRCFDSRNPNADNEGLVVPSSDVVVKGFYMPDIDILVITRFACYPQYNMKPVQTTPEIYLPSYIPRPSSELVMGMVIRTLGSDITTWTWLMYEPNGSIGIRVVTDGTHNETTNACVLSLSGVSQGRSINGIQSFIDQNGVL